MKSIRFFSVFFMLVVLVLSGCTPNDQMHRDNSTSGYRSPSSGGY